MKNVKPNTNNKPIKIKKTYAFRPEIAELIESHKYVHDGCEVDFVSKAIEEYAADIDGEKSTNVLIDRIVTSVRAITRNDINRISHSYFKIAVELAILNYLLAAGYVQMSDEEIRDLRNRAVDTVRKSHGLIYFEDAIKEERGFLDDE